MSVPSVPVAVTEPLHTRPVSTLPSLELPEFVVCRPTNCPVPGLTTSADGIGVEPKLMSPASEWITNGAMVPDPVVASVWVYVKVDETGCASTAHVNSNTKRLANCALFMNALQEK